jgi:hypothetical protein
VAYTCEFLNDNLYKVVGHSCGKGAKSMVGEIWITLAIGGALEYGVASQISQDDKKRLQVHTLSILAR